MEWCLRILSLTLLCSFIHSNGAWKVFQSSQDASAVLQRPKRANSFLFEEIWQGNLERECLEERCTHEEAREYFEDDQKTEAFWTVYYDGDQCLSNPCLHGGSCTDKIGGYNCTCTELYQGFNCERDVSQCHSDGPLSCDHFCHPSFSSYKCSCAEGYKIHTDGRSCQPEGQYPCGRSPIPEDADPQPYPSNPLCPHGHCPWQVRLIHTNGEEFCSGVIVGQHSILTTATCVSLDPDFLVKTAPQGPVERLLGSGGSNSRLSVTKFIKHNKYEKDGVGNDLAVVQLQDHFQYSPVVFRACVPERDFSENVLMRAGRTGLVGNPIWGEADNETLMPSYLPLELCQSKLNFTVPFTNKMFCTEIQELPKGKQGGGSCGHLPGTPIVTMERNTAFLTGLLISRQTRDCTRGQAFTKVSRYLAWIQGHLDKIEK